MNKSKIFAKVAEIEQKRNNVELSKQEIELGVVQDAKKLESKITKRVATIKKATGDLDSKVDKLKERLGKVWDDALALQDKMTDLWQDDALES